MTAITPAGGLPSPLRAKASRRRRFTLRELYWAMRDAWPDLKPYCFKANSRLHIRFRGDHGEQVWVADDWDKQAERLWPPVQDAPRSNHRSNVH